MYCTDVCVYYHLSVCEFAKKISQLSTASKPLFMEEVSQWIVMRDFIACVFPLSTVGMLTRLEEKIIIELIIYTLQSYLPFQSIFCTALDQVGRVYMLELYSDITYLGLLKSLHTQLC